MAQVNKRGSDSRFVSVFADSTPDVDITFMVPFLQRPTDHYIVGVDNLTISLSALGLLDDEADPKNVILQVLRRQAQAGAGNGVAAVSRDPVAFEFGAPADDLFKFRGNAQGVILSLNEFMIQLDNFGSRVSEFIEKGVTAGQTGQPSPGGFIWTYEAPGADGKSKNENPKHLGFYLTPDGRLAIIGSYVFWSQCMIRFPNKKYREIIGATNEFLSLTAASGIEMGIGSNTDAPLKLQPIVKLYDGNGVETWTMNDFSNVDNVNVLAGTWAGNDDLWKNKSHTFLATNCLLSSLDRRVSIELGASLPMLNSPMVDHNQETPDFVLGRWMFPRNAESIITGGSGLTGTSNTVSITQKDVMGVLTLQGAKDRILYHTLRPQAKLQTVRLRLFARVRTYNEALDTWAMKTFAVPTNKTDWWHARLHFVSKD